MTASSGSIMVLIVLLISFSFRFCFGFFVFRHRRLSARYCVGLVGKANKGLRNSWFLRAWRHQSPCSCAGVSAILKRESYSPMLSSVADFGHLNQPVPQRATSVLCLWMDIKLAVPCECTRDAPPRTHAAAGRRV